MESVGYRYRCGDLLFGDGPMSEVIIQKQSLTCESKIEPVYYNPKKANERPNLMLKDICVHCGCFGSSDFLHGMKELRDRNETNGWTYLPICVECKREKKPFVKKGSCKQDKVEAHREKLAKEAAARNASTN